MTARSWRWVGIGLILAPWALAAGCALLPCCRMPLLGGGQPTREWSGELKGPAQAIDGDTLEVGGRRVRLFGIDAPERAQWCESPEGREAVCLETTSKGGCDEQRDDANAGDR